MTTGASEHLARPSRHLGQEKDGRAAANLNVITVASHTKKGNPAGLPFWPSSPSTTPDGPYVLTGNAAGHGAAASAAPSGRKPYGATSCRARLPRHRPCPAPRRNAPMPRRTSRTRPSRRAECADRRMKITATGAGTPRIVRAGPSSLNGALHPAARDAPAARR